MDPEFQRDFVWNEVQQSKLIESILLRIPLPVFYLLERVDGKIMIVDGLQRLSTFRRFESDDLKLRLTENRELNGKRFSDLSMILRERFLECNLRVYIIHHSVSEERCYDIFERVNSGEPLTRQQMRNCLCNGPGTRFLRKEVQTEVFKNATGDSLNSRTMKDREYVNRFCAFRVLTCDDYRRLSSADRMDQFLSKCLRIMNTWDEEKLTRLSNEFRQGLQICYELFGAHAFRRSFLKHPEVTKSLRERSPLLAPLWEVMSTSISRYEVGDIRKNIYQLRQQYRKLLNDDTFQKSITEFAHTPNNVDLRFDLVQRMLGGVLDHPHSMLR